MKSACFTTDRFSPVERLFKPLTIIFNSIPTIISILSRKFHFLIQKLINEFPFNLHFAWISSTTQVLVFFSGIVYLSSNLIAICYIMIESTLKIVKSSLFLALFYFYSIGFELQGIGEFKGLLWTVWVLIRQK